MKRNILLVAFLATITMLLSTSCSNKKRILGIWKITYASTEVSCDQGESWTFKDDGTCTAVLIYDGLEFKWSIDNNNLVMTSRIDDVDVTGNFSIDKINGKEMSISGKWIESADGEVDSASVSYVFEKQ